MVCSGVPEKNDHHAAEVSKMGLDLLAKVYEIYKWAKMLKIVKQIYTPMCRKCCGNFLWFHEKKYNLCKTDALTEDASIISGGQVVAMPMQLLWYLLSIYLHCRIVLYKEKLVRKCEK